MSKIVDILLIVIVISLAACTPKDKFYYFEKFKYTYPLLEKYEWDVLYGGPDGGGTIDVLARTVFKGDTVLQAKLIRSFDLNGNYAYDIELSKIYDGNDSSYFESINEDFTRKYALKSTLKGIEVFIIGKYYYLYEYDLLNKNQRAYFMLHLDSLKNVRGNELPPLPSN